MSQNPLCLKFSTLKSKMCKGKKRLVIQQVKITPVTTDPFIKNSMTYNDGEFNVASC